MTILATQCIKKPYHIHYMSVLVLLETQIPTLGDIKFNILIDGFILSNTVSFY